MIKLKSAKELEVMREAGTKLKKVMQELLPKVQVGISTEYIDKIADELIRKQGGTPGFKKVYNYRWATCLPINEQAVHTPPSKRSLKEGDVLTIDIGLFYKGLHTDHAISMIVGETKDAETVKFLKVGKETLYKAIKKAKAGNYIGDISAVIEEEIYKNGYHILQQLTGHGIGKDLHEDPMIPGFVDRQREKTAKIKAGMVLAIEVIYSMGTEQIAYEQGSDWSIISKDKSLAACFEHTVAIFEKEAVILT